MERPAVYIASDVIESERSGRGKCERERASEKERREREGKRERERYAEGKCILVATNVHATPSFSRRDFPRERGLIRFASETTLPRSGNAFDVDYAGKREALEILLLALYKGSEFFFWEIFL